MAGPRPKKRLWKEDEDNKLKHFKTEFPNLSWRRIAKLGSWTGMKKVVHIDGTTTCAPGINKEKFSQKEDELIIFLKGLGVRWTSMPEFVLGRSANAVKNRWNNHLKKKDATIDDSLDLIPNLDPNAIRLIPGPNS